jgi:hypothetical protein
VSGDDFLYDDLPEDPELAFLSLEAHFKVYASLTARKTEVLRKAKIVSANLEHGVNLGSQYLVEFSDGSRLVIDQGHIRPFRA